MKAALAVLLLLAAAPAHGQTALRVGYQKVGSMVVLRQQHRLEQDLKNVNVTWVEFNAGPPIMEALNAGAIDFAYAGDSPPIFALAAGIDIVLVASQPVSGDGAGILVHDDSPIHAVADLRGKRIAFTKGSSAHNVAVKALEKGGLKLTDVQVSTLAPADAAAAFSRGSVDAWSIWDPFYAVAQQRPDYRVLVTSGDVVRTNNFFVARRKFADANPALMRSMVDEINATATWVAAHPEDVVQAMSQITGVPLEPERLAAGRGSYTAAFLTPEVTAQEQAVADTFAGLQIIPGHVDIAAAVWTPPTTGAAR